MQTVNTVRVNREWLDNAIKNEGTLGRFASKIGVTKSTVSRQARRQAEASPRFIGAVLAHYPVTFHDAFDVTEEKVEVRRARMVKTLAA
ncbi:hypothetical protein NY035_01915 [Corynebacterium diphtheriae bv. mitis]|uniref:hypothetical protein n=1 Tax=Corynebacterium diphtheriae TaxID=1717 RepID=UPI0013CC5361|nr:hypothetical protein [Corynebacterium diphtheriae]MBG9359006.1 hypothetical protein [Corynebacterium diphtheriae bv. mitis]MBG9361150.1 hypothetical protein [Corynebacterium diphtheriae bv. mitis]MBG9363315.1 hypothetical protein [Corynebacterium diphtheriae bv. mitis]MBG9365457.1 hypothetical protein [Corynebacterium diphtheriae bv. mitis]UJL53389.1 hypothetical protein FE380_03855 [Corynebacterium diphtheriae]